jgi:hypothetical protein
MGLWTTRRWISIAVIAAFGALWVFAIFQIRPWDAPKRREVQQAALAEGRAMLQEDLPAPPGAEPYAPLEERLGSRRGFSLELSREYHLAGRFADTVEWYRAQLAPLGWKPFDPDGWREFHADFCLAPWIIEIQRSASYEELAAPEHRFIVRLRWSDSFTAERCPLPENELL